MAQTYYECDGNTRRALTVNGVVGGATYYDQTTNANGTLVTTTYKRMTFTVSPGPLSNLRVWYSYLTAAVYNSSVLPTNANYYLGNKMITFNAGQTSKVIDIPTKIEYCYTDGDVDQFERDYAPMY